MSHVLSDILHAGDRKIAAHSTRIHLIDAVAVGLLIALSAYLFRYHIFGEFIFFGNPDRLNNNLKVLRYYVDGLASGGLSAWNETELLGYDSFALPYTFPNPLTYVTHWFGPENIYITAGFISAALLAAAGVAAYAFIVDVVRRRGPAVVGAILYEFAAITTLKVSQNDMSFAVFVLIPLLALSIRRTGRHNAASSFVAALLLLVFMLQFTFLQKAAYAVMLIGSYAAYRTLSGRDWRPLAVFAMALVVALIATSPRFVSLAGMMSEYVRQAPRADVEPQTVFAIEILRWFDETIFGKYLSEATAKLNMINLSEGFLLYTSSFVPFVVIAGLVRYRSRWLGLPTERQDDAAFFFWAGAFTFAATLSQTVLLVVYKLFLSLDFIHSRILVAGLLPLACIVALILRDLSPNPGVESRRRAVLAAGTACVAALLINLGIETAAQRWDGNWLLPAAYNPNYNFGNDRTFQALDRAAVIRISLSGLCALALLIMIRTMKSTVGRVFAYYLLVIIIPIQTLFAANMRINHEHTWNSPAPFEGGDIYQSPRGDFRPPSAQEVQVLHKYLRPDVYRSAILCDQKISGGFCAGHIGQFWRLRLVDGYYGVGVPARISALPWEDRRGMRSVSFASDTKLPWPLLALLNVRYAIRADDALYRNTFPDASALRPKELGGALFIRESPVPVTPRVFFARSAQPVASADDAVSRLFKDDKVADVRQTSFVEGLPKATEFSDRGNIEFSGRGDHLEIKVNPVAERRFLVINELYYSGWHGRVDGKPAIIYPTNAVMRGIVLPAGAQKVTLDYVPPTRSGVVALSYAGALLLASLVILFLRRASAPFGWLPARRRADILRP